METAEVNTHDKSISVYYFHSSAVVTCNGLVENKLNVDHSFGAGPIFFPSAVYDWSVQKMIIILQL